MSIKRVSSILVAKCCGKHDENFSCSIISWEIGSLNSSGFLGSNRLNPRIEFGQMVCNFKGHREVVVVRDLQADIAEV